MDLFTIDGKIFKIGNGPYGPHASNVFVSTSTDSCCYEQNFLETVDPQPQTEDWTNFITSFIPSTVSAFKMSASAVHYSGYRPVPYTADDSPICRAVVSADPVDTTSRTMTIPVDGINANFIWHQYSSSGTMICLSAELGHWEPISRICGSASSSNEPMSAAVSVYNRFFGGSREQWESGGCSSCSALSPKNKLFGAIQFFYYSGSASGVSDEFVGFDTSNPLGLPPKTVRLWYPDYYLPTFTYGSADQVSKFPNIWDWKYDNSSWHWGLAWTGPATALGSNTKGVTSFDYLFEDSDINRIDSFDIHSCTDLGVMFAYATSLSSINIGDTRSVTSFYGTFTDCSSLTAIPTMNMSAAKNVRSMLKDCYSIQSGALELYQRLTSMPTPPSSHSWCFSRCGRNTPIGSAELEQIPATWGGMLKEYQDEYCLEIIPEYCTNILFGKLEANPYYSQPILSGFVYVSGSWSAIPSNLIDRLNSGSSYSFSGNGLKMYFSSIDGDIIYMDFRGANEQSYNETNCTAVLYGKLIGSDTWSQRGSAAYNRKQTPSQIGISSNIVE